MNRSERYKRNLLIWQIIWGGASCIATLPALWNLAMAILGWYALGFTPAGAQYAPESHKTAIRSDFRSFLLFTLLAAVLAVVAILPTLRRSKAKKPTSKH